MNANHLQILSKFFDGEAVDPALLAESLAQPDAATYLAECAALRAWVREDESRPSERFYEAMHRVLRTGGVRKTLWRRLVPPALAAGILLAGVALGYEYRSRSEPRPTPTTLVQTGPSPTTPGIDRSAAPQSVTAPPTPTASMPPAREGRSPRGVSLPVPVAQLRFGSWRERSRGGEEH
jgi:hypothetical protein